MWAVRRRLLELCGGCSGCTCPRFFSDKFHLELLGQRQQHWPTFAACRGARQPPGLELTDPPAQPSHDYVLTSAHLNPHRSLRWSPPSLPTAAARRPEVVGTLPRPLPPPPASPPPTEAPRSRYAYLACVHVRHACTCIVPLTGPHYLTLTAATLHWPRVPTVPGPCAHTYRVPAGA